MKHGMKTAIVLALVGLLMPAVASAHPHMWISQAVRVVTKDGKYTHVEIEWKFDPESSEDEIPAIDEDKDGKISPKELELLAHDTMASLEKFGFMTWLNTGGKDFHPTNLPTFSARIDDPPTFTPPDWDRSEGDRGMPMPTNKQAQLPAPAEKHSPRNLVYTMRFELPRPTKALSITTYDPEDFMRFEVDKAKLPSGCKFAKHPTYKSEFVPGHPVFADMVSCKLP
jgi:ABC-type uncharacterized transport system substrate-binding protein